MDLNRQPTTDAQIGVTPYRPDPRQIPPAKSFRLLDRQTKGGRGPISPLPSSKHSKSHKFSHLPFPISPSKTPSQVPQTKPFPSLGRTPPFPHAATESRLEPGNLFRDV